MKLEITPEVLLLLKAVLVLLSGVFAAVSWLLTRMVKTALLLIQQRKEHEKQINEHMQRLEMERQRWEDFEVFRLQVMGDGSNESPGLMLELRQAKQSALDAVSELRSLKSVLGISDRHMKAVQRDAIRRKLGINEDIQVVQEEVMVTTTGRHRALQMSELPPPAPRRKHVEGRYTSRDDDPSSDPPDD